MATQTKTGTAGQAAAWAVDACRMSRPAYRRTSEAAQALGLTVKPTDIEGQPAFLLGCDGQPWQLLPDLACVHTALDRTDTAAPLPQIGGDA